MDKISHYRQIVQDILTAHGQIQPVYGEIEMELLFDLTRDRYQVLRAGWLQKQRVYGALIHIDITGEKLWIQYDGTEVGVANELVEQGIPKEDIVLAYHDPFIRQYDGFAVSWWGFVNTHFWTIPIKTNFIAIIQGFSHTLARNTQIILLVNTDAYILPPFIFNSDTPIKVFAFGSGSVKFGYAVISSDVLLYVTDGQHRLKAIETHIPLVEEAIRELK